MAVVQGDSFLSAAAGGFFGSLGAKAWGGAMKNLGYEKFAQSTIGTVAFGALSGGIGAELSGGNFWQGAVTGGIVAGLNHSLHKMNSTDLINGQEQNQQKDPWDLDGNGELNLHEANNWYRNGNGKDIILDASKIDLNFVDTSGWRKGDIKGIQTLFRSRNGTVLGNITVKYHGNNVVSILPDVYDFESHPKSPIRNLATKLGKWKAGEGIPYKIIFRGKNVIGSKTYRQ